MGPETSAVLISAGVTAAVAAIGAIALTRLARDRPSHAALGAPIVVVASLAAGVAAATRSMLIGEHDYRTVLFVILAGAPMAILIGVLLARRVRTMERRVAEELAERQRAEAVEAGRRETITWLTHDLRTPLSGIRLVAEALQDDPQDVSGQASRIIREADRMSGMVDDITELSRLHGDPDRPRERVAVTDLVSDAVAAVSPLADASGIEISLMDCPATDLVADVPALSRAVTNVVRNAVQHTPVGGRVTMDVSTTGRQLAIAVSDECGGVPEQDLARMLEPGWRGDVARGAGRGMGLGLAIAHEVARSHDGEVTVRNTPDGVGCTVAVIVGITDV